MKIALSTESCTDFTQELLDKYNIKSLPLYVYLGEQEYLDGTLSNQSIFDFVKQSKKLPKTSAPNESDYENHFNDLLKTNDIVLHLSISSGVSSCYSHAQNVSKSFDNVYVIDTKSIATGIGLLCIYARKLIDSGLDIQGIVTLINQKIDSVCTTLIIKELNYLYKGGRCNGLICLGANLLKIHPVLIVKNGFCKQFKKFIGNIDNCIMRYTTSIFNDFKNPDLENVFLQYTNVNQETIENVKQELIKKGFKNIYLITAGAVITSYTGEQSLSIIFLNK